MHRSRKARVLGDDPGAHDPAIGYAGDADALRIDDAVGDQPVQPAQDILSIRAAHVPGNGVREILAATGAAARIGLKDRIAGPQQGDIERAAPDAAGAPGPDRAAMNIDDDGAWAAVADGAQQPAMNFPAVSLWNAACDGERTNPTAEV